MTTTLRAVPDHLVVWADTLDEGAAWCERTLGVTPQAGGRHTFMGTHNLLVNVSSDDFPKTYLEIIAIDPDSAAPPHPRWFDMDDAALRERVRTRGPQWIHWVARCMDAQAVRDAWADAGYDPGVVHAAERQTAHGPLRWRITLPVDGRRLGHGALPTLIEWGEHHPCDALPDVGLRWTAAQVTAPADATLLTATLTAPVTVQRGDDWALRIALQRADGQLVHWHL